jgi:hypothetical protein
MRGEWSRDVSSFRVTDFLPSSLIPFPRGRTKIEDGPFPRSPFSVPDGQPLALRALAEGGWPTQPLFRWLAHAMRWRSSHRTVGHGHLCGRRFESFPVQPENLARCRPFGDDASTQRIAKRIGPEHALRGRGRPNKKQARVVLALLSERFSGQDFFLAGGHRVAARNSPC